MTTATERQRPRPTDDDDRPTMRGGVRPSRAAVGPMTATDLRVRVREAPRRARRWMQRPVDPAPLVIFRVAFGLMMAAAAVRFLAKGWVETQYIDPDFHFRYYLFQWIPELPGGWLYLVFAAQIVAALLIAAGWRYRVATIAFFVSFSYVELLDQATYLNHYYFISLVGFLLIVLPLHRWSSLDARRGDMRGEPWPARWIALVLQVQIALVYFFAGIAKLNSDWLFEAQPLGIWLAARSGFPVLGVLFDQPWSAYLMSWAGAAFDLSIPFLLFWRRSRPWAYVAIVGFHLTTALLFPIGVFPWVMILSTLVFFDAEDFARARRWMGRLAVSIGLPGAWTGEARSTTARAVPRPARGLRPGVAVGVVLVPFFALQLLLPLRHLAYPGPVLWTEEGFRFSWRVMLVEKTGMVIFSVTDPGTGRSWDVFPGDHLTPQQERQLAFQPDMILGFAHHLRDELVRDGIADPEIRARAFVSLNGRRSQPFVDPDVDLAKEPRSLAPKTWILARTDL